MERDPSGPVDRVDLPAHVIAADHELAARRSPLCLESEHVTPHAPVQREGEAKARSVRSKKRGRSRDLRPLLLQVQAYVAVRISFSKGSGPRSRHVYRHQRSVDPVLLRTAAREHEDYPDDDPGCSHVLLSHTQRPTRVAGRTLTEEAASL